MINVAIIGTGNISRMHIEAYKKFPERVKIVALVDIVPEKAVERKEFFDLKDAKVYDSHEKILDDDSIDLVSVCTPPYAHASISIDFLEHGKNVICEKPMAPSLEECDQMIAALEKSGKTMSVIAQNRFRDPVMKLKKTLDQGFIGRVLHTQVDSFWWRGHSYYDLWWRGLWEKEGGGCTLNHAVHHIDMLGWMMGDPESITSVISNANHDNSEVEDISVSIMKYAHGALAQVTASTIHHGEEQKVIFQGEKGKISVPWSLITSVSLDNGFPAEEGDRVLEKQIKDYYNSIPDLKYSAHDGQIDDVLTAIENGTEPLIKAEDGRRTIELITGIYESGSLEKTVKLPITPEDPFYTEEGKLAHVPHFFKKTSYAKELNKGVFIGNDYNTAYEIKK